MQLMTFRTECAHDIQRVYPLLEKLNVELSNQDGCIFTIKARESVDRVRERMVSLIMKGDRFVDLHRCFQTLNTGTEPDNFWFMK